MQEPHSQEKPQVRYRPIDRSRTSSASLDVQLPANHPVRLLWQFACGIDLSAFARPTKATVDAPGAPVISPDVLFALWVFAISDGVASGRRIAELCERDLPYQWLCGGVAINYHTLNDFYSQNTDALQTAFVEHVAALRQQGLIDLRRVTLDGRKVPAAVDKQTLHREGTLQSHLEEAKRHLEAVLAEQDDSSRNAKQQAARRRGAEDRQKRLGQAIAAVHQRQQERQRTNRASIEPEDARASETDPDVAKMKMSDGGYRPAYNVQTVMDEKSGLIVTVDVTSQGSDNGLLLPMVEKVEREQKERPKQVLADSGYSSQDDVQGLEEKKVEVLMPPKNEKKEKEAGKDPYAKKRRDSAEVERWRKRMGEGETRKAYKRRAPVAEGVHARQSNGGFKKIRLRGRDKARAEVLWQALAHNLGALISRGVALRGAVRAR